MSAVTDGADILYCVDTFEVVVEGDIGDKDQWAPGAIPPSAVASSKEGVIPSVGISFDQAVGICANTPVIGPDGEQYGVKHLVTREEWRDAADGVPGPGGTEFPYGNEVDADICATPDQFGNPVYDGLQPTGSLPDCVSAFGLYDQCGNAWEWADAGLATDAEVWFDLTASAGLMIEVDDDGYLSVSSGWAPSLVHLMMMCGIGPDLTVDEDGRLLVWLNESSQAQFSSGLLMFGDGFHTISGDEFLPVVLGLPDVPSFPFNCPLIPILDPPSVPIPVKLGGAYYAGFPDSCGTMFHGLRHTHDFDGTIGFRCACPPMLFKE